MIHELRLFFVALQFMTRVPVPRWVGYEAAWLNDSARYFPAVGLCVGACAAATLVLAHAVLGTAVAVGLSMAASVVLTGGFHEDGLADTCDALGGTVDRERALAIMKDSRIGSYGALGLLLVLGLKAAALATLPLALAVPALLMAHTASRAAAVLVIRALPYAGDAAHAKAKPMAQRVGAAGASLALAWVPALALLIVWHRPSDLPALGMGLLLAGVAGIVCARCWQRRLGGYTGDTLGATQQLTELMLLLGWLVAARMP